MDFYFIQWVIICYCHYFDVPSIPDLATGNSFKLTSVFFQHVPIIFPTTFHFLFNKIFQALESAIFPRSLGSFQWRMVCRNQDMGIIYVRCC